MPLAFTQETRKAIRQRVGYLLHGRSKFAVGVVTAPPANSTSFTSDVAKRFPDDYFVGSAVLNVTIGAAIYPPREISNHTQSTGLITVAVGWSTEFGPGQQIEIWPSATDYDLVNAHLNLAILRASDIVNIYQEVAPLAIDSERLVITLPTSFVKVAGLYYYEDNMYYEWSPAGAWHDIRGPRSWTLRGNKLYLSEPISESIADASVMIQGYRAPALMDADADLAEVRSDYLTLMTAYLIDAGQAEGQVLDPEQHAGRAGQWLREAQAIEARMITNWLPNTQEVHG